MTDEARRRPLLPCHEPDCGNFHRRGTPCPLAGARETIARLETQVAALEGREAERVAALEAAKEVTG